MILSLTFLLAGTIFTIHESLLIKKHELTVAAKEINILLKEMKREGNIEKFATQIEQGLKFISKKELWSIEVFDSNGNPIYHTSANSDVIFENSEFPQKIDSFYNHFQWQSWDHWRINSFFRGDGCYIKMSLVQKLEMEEDISTFFIASFIISTILSFLVGKIITSSILKRAGHIEKAARIIAGGNLKHRIPESTSNDELRIIENNLNNAFGELEESFDKVMQFSSDIAHELRTPLTIITGEIDVALAEQRSTGEYQTLMVNILEEVSLLRKIIDDMLILVKPQSAYTSIEREDIDISAMLEDLVLTYSIIGDAKNIKLTVDIQPDIHWKGIKSMVYLIFSNLIHNAIKYTKNNGTVTITLRQERSIQFVVSDNGPGIPKEEQENIFSRFYRLNSTANRGCGLGLAIVRKACEVSHADISLDSSPGKGSTFTVIFT